MHTYYWFVFTILKITIYCIGREAVMRLKVKTFQAIILVSFDLQHNVTDTNSVSDDTNRDSLRNSWRCLKTDVVDSPRRLEAFRKPTGELAEVKFWDKILRCAQLTAISLFPHGPSSHPHILSV
jgi:hypothetical protein